MLSFVAGRLVSASTSVLAVALTCAALLALPGQTVTTRYLNDLFLILDHVHRVTWGDVPNRDFHTPLGPLASYVPAAGYWLTGTLGGAIPAGMAVLTLALAPAIAHVVTSRLHPAIAVFYGAFLLLILAVPTNLGEGVLALSFMKFYNRIGWVALCALLIMYLRPREGRGSPWLDAPCAAFLTVVLIYTKATYGLVAVIFVLFLLLDEAQRRWAASALALLLAAATVIELIWRSSFAYIADLRVAFLVNGGLRGTWGLIMDQFLDNLADYVLFSLFTAIALRRTRRIRDALFYSLCAVVGFLLINQNFQASGIITLHAAAAVAAETVVRQSEDGTALPEASPWFRASTTKLLFIAFVLPTISYCSIALGLHATAAATRVGDAMPFSNLDRVRYANLWTWGDYWTGVEYLRTVEDGAAALVAMGTRPERVVVLDFTNPFSVALGLRPAKGDTPWLQWERTVSASTYLTPERLLGGAEIVIVPKPPREMGAAETAVEAAASLIAIYGSFLAANFELVRETEYWIIHRRRHQLHGTKCHFCGAETAATSQSQASRQ